MTRLVTSIPDPRNKNARKGAHLEAMIPIYRWEVSLGPLTCQEASSPAGCRPPWALWLVRAEAHPSSGSRWALAGIRHVHEFSWPTHATCGPTFFAMWGRLQVELETPGGKRPASNDEQKEKKTRTFAAKCRKVKAWTSPGPGGILGTPEDDADQDLVPQVALPPGGNFRETMAMLRTYEGFQGWSDAQIVDHWQRFPMLPAEVGTELALQSMFLGEGSG